MNESFLILCLCHASSATTCAHQQTPPSGRGRARPPGAPTWNRSWWWWWWSSSSTYLVQPPVGVHRLRVGLVLDAVQVFVEAVQQEGHELLGVVLRVARELAGFTGHDCLGRDREKRLSASCLRRSSMAVRSAEVPLP